METLLGVTPDKRTVVSYSVFCNLEIFAELYIIISFINIIILAIFVLAIRISTLVRRFVFLVLGIKSSIIYFLSVINSEFFGLEVFNLLIRSKVSLEF